MTREYQEATTEHMRSQNNNPIVSGAMLRCRDLRHLFSQCPFPPSVTSSYLTFSFLIVPIHIAICYCCCLG